MHTIKKISTIISYLLIASSIASYAQNDCTRKADSLRLIVAKTQDIEKVDAICALVELFGTCNHDSAMRYSSMALDEARRTNQSLPLFKAYNASAKAHLNSGNNDRAIQLFSLALQHKSSCRNVQQVIELHQNIATAYRSINKHAPAIEHLQTAAEIANGIEDYKTEGNINITLARYSRDIGDYTKALKYALKALAIFRSNQLTDQYTKAYRSIAIAYMEQKDLVNAEKYYNLTTKLLLEENNPKNLVDLYIELGIFYYNHKNYSKSIDHYIKGIEYAKTLNDQLRLTALHLNLSLVYYDMGKYQQAIEYSNMAWENVDLFNSVEMRMNIAIYMANTRLKMGNISKAKKFIAEVEPHVSVIVNPILIREFYQIKGDLAYLDRNIDDVYRYKKLENQYGDTISSKNQIKAMREAQAQFDTKVHEHEIELLKSQNSWQQTKNNFLIAFTILLITISIAILYLSLKIVKKNKQLSAINMEMKAANDKLMESKEILRRTNSTKDTIFSIIGHDLKNPFNVMLGFCQLLDINYRNSNEAQYRSYINLVAASARNIYNLLDNLLQWSKTQTENIQYRPAPLDMQQLVEEEINLLTPSATIKNITISTSIAPDTNALADPHSISVVVRNLIGNALKFTSEGGTINVAAWHNPQHSMLEVAVIDNGVGLSEEELKLIFVAKGSYTTKGTSNETGTGLGLMLCKEFVESNGGNIWAVSQKGKGSEFHFTLPTPHNITQQ